MILIRYQYSAIRIGLSIPSMEVIIIFTVALLGGELSGCPAVSLRSLEVKVGVTRKAGEAYGREGEMISIATVCTGTSMANNGNCTR